jgi:predicted HAD superfamily Cof-like phosphohydrolase
MHTRYIALREFHTAFMLPLDMPWQQFVDERAAFRYALLEEEFAEWLDATRTSDRVEQLDALIDVQYIALGTLVECGGMPDMARYHAQPIGHESLTEMVDATRPEQVHALDMATFSANVLRLIDRTEFMGRNLMFDMEAAFTEVHRSNMAKLGPDGKPLLNGINCPLDVTKPEGKVLKPKDWRPPVLQPFVGR